jgi:glycosyltransferase involved in cell wall biosynthesis
MNIGPMIERLFELYGDYIHEIVPVDDNSRDSTAALLASYAARNPRIRPLYRKPPNGVGRALSDGYSAATGVWVLSLDSDFQHLLPEIRDMFDLAARGSPVVVGSRFSLHSVLINYPFLKILFNRSFHLLAQIVLGKRFRDVTNNLKLMRSDVVKRLHLTAPGFAVNAEIGLQPMFMGYPIAEVPISWINRSSDMGSSSFKLLLWDFLRARAFGRGPYAALSGIAPREMRLTEGAADRTPKNQE